MHDHYPNRSSNSPDHIIVGGRQLLDARLARLEERAAEVNKISNPKSRRIAEIEVAEELEELRRTDQVIAQLENKLAIVKGR